MMEKRTFGKTGLEVTPLGFGSSEMGDRDFSLEQADELFNGLLDIGVNVFDTASCYGNAEEKIGKTISGRRDEFVLISKCGHANEPDDAKNWSPELVTTSCERSLKRMKTDRLDVLLLHSCSPDELANDDMIDALRRCREQGKTRFIGYSGDDEPAMKAAGMDVFDAMETSLNFCDQQVLDRHLPAARENDLGLIVKRPIANACWRPIEAFRGFYKTYIQPYKQRLETMKITPEAVGFDGSWVEMSLRFSMFQPGTHTGIVGSTNLEHMKSNAAIIEKGPLPDEVVDTLRQLWKENDDGTWVGLV